MTRIVLSPTDLADTASVLENASGEYQAIGTRISSCDCGCMPADVAATVEAATAHLRMRLSGISGELAGEASELAWRAGVSHNGGSSPMAMPTVATTSNSISIGPLAGLGAAGSQAFLSIPGLGGFGAAQPGLISIGGTAPQPAYAGTLSIGGLGAYNSAANGAISISGGSGMGSYEQRSVSIDANRLTVGPYGGDGSQMVIFGASDAFRNSAWYRHNMFGSFPSVGGRALYP